MIHLILNTGDVEARPRSKDPVLELSETTVLTPLRRVPTAEEEVRVSPSEPTQAPQKSEELGWQAFYRPKGSQGFPVTMPVTDQVDQSLGHLRLRTRWRWRHDPDTLGRIRMGNQSPL